MILYYNFLSLPKGGLFLFIKFKSIERSENLNIRVNGQTEIVEQQTTITDILNQKSLNPDNVVVEYNLNIVKSDKWNNTILKENDSLEVLSFVGGG